MYYPLAYVCIMCVLSVKDFVWEMCDSERPHKARLEVDDYFLRPRCVNHDERGKLTITSETQNPLLMSKSSDIWTTLCEVIKKFYTCSVVSFVHKKRVKKRVCGDGNAEER